MPLRARHLSALTCLNLVGSFYFRCLELFHRSDSEFLYFLVITKNDSRELILVTYPRLKSCLSPCYHPPIPIVTLFLLLNYKIKQKYISHNVSVKSLERVTHVVCF